MRVLSHPATAWLTLLGALCATGVAWRAAVNAQDQIARDQFVFRSNEMAAAILRRVAEHEGVMRGAAGLLGASERVSREEWRQYVDALALEQRHPGFVALGYAAYLPQAERQALVAAVRAEGFADFDVWPPGIRDEYHVIVYIEPFVGRNLRAFGYDMFSEPVRRAAIERARDAGLAAVTSRVRLVQESGIDEQRGFLMYLPVYRNGAPHSTVAERRAALVGNVYSPFRAADLLHGIFGSGTEHKEILYGLYAGEVQNDATLLYRSDRDEAWHNGDVQRRSLPLEIAGSHWSLLCQERSPGVLAGASRHDPWFVAGAGLLINALLFVVVLVMGKVQSRAAKLARDMTAELRETEERFRFVLDRAHDAFVAIDKDSKVRFWNRAAEVTFGWSQAEILGQALPEFIIPKTHRDAHLRGLARFVQTGSSSVLNRRIELVALHRDGREFPIEITITPMKIGASYQFNAFLHDITERKHLQEEMIRAKDAAELGTRAKSDFLARMSHEIRTPLNGMLGMTELLLRTKLSTEQRDYLETAHASGRGLLQIINDILDFSRIEAGKLELDSVPFSLRQMLSVSLRALAARMQPGSVELLVSVPERVPDALVGDAQRLGQVILNLAGNAIKFTERGEVLVAVDVAAAREACVELEFRISDTGVGIPAHKQALIFEAFAQADPATHSRFGGTGLGLAISSQLVKLMHGRIDVQSELGRGSVSSFTARMERAPGPPAPSHDLSAVHNRSVLLAMAGETGRKLLLDQLTAWGMRATPASDGASALRLLRDGPRHDLVLLDEQLIARAPEAVRDFMAELRAAAEGAAILLIGSAVPAAETWNAPDDLALPRVQKPVFAGTLLEHLQTLLGGRKALPRAAVTAQLDPGQRPCRILVAEDNIVNRKVATALLERAGHEVVCVENGHQALAATASQRFDLVLMDVQMPGLDGLAATRQIRARELATGSAHLPIVALTAQAIKGDQDRCLDAGMDAYITKPVEPASLYKVIQKFTLEQV